MTDDRFDKLMNIMLEFKDDFNQFKVEMYDFRNEMYKFKEEMYEFKEDMYKFKEDMSIFRNEIDNRFGRVDSSIDLIAMKQWNNEKDINFVKKTIGNQVKYMLTQYAI